MSEFCIENHEVFGSLTQNCLQLDKDKSTVYTSSVVFDQQICSYYHSKEQLSEKFKQRFAFAHLFPDISIKPRKLHFQS